MKTVFCLGVSEHKLPVILDGLKPFKQLRYCTSLLRYFTSVFPFDAAFYLYLTSDCADDEFTHKTYDHLIKHDPVWDALIWSSLRLLTPTTDLKPAQIIIVRDKYYSTISTKTSVGLWMNLLLTCWNINIWYLSNRWYQKCCITDRSLTNRHLRVKALQNRYRCED